MPFYYDQDADRLNISNKELETLNEALRKSRRTANPPELHGNARLWFGRVFRLNKAIDGLPDRFNAFRNASGSAIRPVFRIVKLVRVEPPYVRAEIMHEGKSSQEIVSLPLLSLEKAVERLVDAYESGTLLDDKGYIRHRLTSENAEQLIKDHCPAL